tara:strand:- start:70 stop:699 length:630 start_codon:yes stop_codon:yes gene_type:complete
MKKKDNNKDYKKKLRILEDVKAHVVKDGWTKNILKKTLNKNVNNSDLIYLFPNGYRDLLELSLSELNKSLENKISKINIINLSISKRIKKILLVRLEILNKEKNFFKKTFYHLILPQNSKIMKKNLYQSVDNMWYLAGDNSTDFSFYTKRLILAAIYTNALFIFFNNNIETAEKNIEKNLKLISKIPKFKQKFSFIKDNLPIFLKSILN